MDTYGNFSRFIGTFNSKGGPICECLDGHQVSNDHLSCVPSVKEKPSNFLMNEVEMPKKDMPSEPQKSSFLNNFKVEKKNPQKEEVKNTVADKIATTSQVEVEKKDSIQIRQSFLSRSFISVKNFFSRIFK